MAKVIDVSVTLVLSMTVATSDEKVARREARRFVDGMGPDPNFVNGWNETVEAEGRPQIMSVGLDIEGTIDTDEAYDDA